MKEILLYSYLSSLLFISVMAFVLRKDVKSRKLFILVPFLIYAFAQELFLFFYLKDHPSAQTGILYNIYKPINVLVFATIYYRLPINAPSRKLIGSLVVVYLLTTIVTFIAFAPVTKVNGYLNAAGGFVITFCSIIFLFNYFKLDNTEVEKFWRPLIWITIGVLTFYPVINISWAFRQVLLNNDARFMGFKLYQGIPQLMSIFMYGCFAYAFYLCKKTNPD